MPISSADRKFIERRERATRLWPYFGVASLVVLAGTAGWLWFTVPNLVDPWQVLASLEAGTMPESTLSVMAVLLPLVTVALLIFVSIVILWTFVAFSNERRLIRMLRALEAVAVSGASREPPSGSA